MSTTTHRQLQKLAWKNVIRHPQSTIQCVIAITISLIILSLLFGIIGGMEKDIKYNITHFFAGDVVLQNAEYRENEAFNPYYYVIPNTQEIVNVLSSLDDVKAVVARLHIPVTLVQAEEFESLIMTGIDFVNEQSYNDIQKHVIAGRIPNKNEKEALLGKATADAFGVTVGDTITLMGSTALRGSNGISVKITGIIEYDQDVLNERKIFVWLPLAQQFFQGSNTATEINILQATNSNMSSEKFLERIQTTLQKHTLDANVYSTIWRETHSIARMMNLYRVIYLIIGFVFCLLGSLVVYNTIFMALLNRRYELGVMGAMGFTNKELRWIFNYEVLCIVALGAIMGLLIGNGIVLIMGSIGLSFQKIEMIDVLSPTLYPSLSLFWSSILFIYGTAICFVVGVLPVQTIKKYSVLQLLKD